MNGNLCKVVFKPFKIDEKKFLRELVKHVDRLREARGLEPIKGPVMGWQGMGRNPVKRRLSGTTIVKTRQEAEQVLAARRKEADELFKIRLLLARKGI